MDVITIFQTLLRWGIVALIGGFLLILILGIGYFLYKNKLHGTKELSKGQWLLLFLLSCWLLMVFALTTISRGANYTGSFNFNIFSGYINAWNKWSVSELQLILFNMLMFMPLGFLLPLLWKKAERFWIMLSVSLAITLFIEAGQLLTGRGIFELDDLLHNSIGSLFGYFCIMAILSMIRDKRLHFVPIGKALLIPVIISAVLFVVFVVYEKQPYGNMSILPAVKQDMSLVDCKTTVEWSDEPSSASVYQSVYVKDKTYMKHIVEAIADIEGVSFSSTPRWEGESCIYLGSNGQSDNIQLEFFTRNGTWYYTTWKETAPIPKEKITQKKEKYEQWLAANDLLPDTAEFTLQNNDILRWDAAEPNNLKDNAITVSSGMVMIQFDSEGNLAYLSDGIYCNEYTATEEIRSPQEAFTQVEEGNFEQYLPFEKGDTLFVDKCELTYIYDSKGYYQPVYCFEGYINERENAWSCYIPALVR